MENHRVSPWPSYALWLSVAKKTSKMIFKITFLIFTCISFIQSFAQDKKPSISQVWVADNGDGTYKNPVLYADYSDPDAIRVGEDYYMTSSSFEDIPGLPILHSKDLVNWTIIGHALTRLPP